MATNELLQSTLWRLSGARLICHCNARQACHAGVIIEDYRRHFPNSFDRTSDNGVTPTSRVPKYLAFFRQEPESESGSSADEGVPGPGAGWWAQDTRADLFAMACSSRRQVDGRRTQESIQQQNTGEKCQGFSWISREDMAQLTS